MAREAKVALVRDQDALVVRGVRLVAFGAAQLNRGRVAEGAIDFLAYRVAGNT